MDKYTQQALSNALFFFIVFAPILYGVSRLVKDPLSVTSAAISAAIGATIYFFLVRKRLQKKSEK